MPRRLVASFFVFWWSVGLGLLYLSVITAWTGARRAEGGRDVHAVIIGSVEAVAAVLFLIPRTLAAGAMGLLATIAVAVVVHAMAGQFAVPLVMYAAAVWFVFVHGPVSGRGE